MADPEDPATSKRKASPNIAVDDATDKRIKLDDGRAHAAPHGNNGLDGNPHEPPSEPPKGTAGEGQDEKQLRESPQPSHLPNPEPERQAPEARRQSATGGPPLRRNFSLEEKKRGQRLFGGLLSTLSRTTSGNQQQRRLEIERRQHEKAQQRRAEDERRRAERFEQLKRIRQIEQVELDERAMKTRHSTMLAKAHSLQTRSEPSLCYLPWKLTRAQEDIIDEQIRTTEETIHRETREFRARKEQRLRELGVAPPLRSPSAPPSPRQETQQKKQQKPEPGNKPPSGEATVGERRPPPQDANPDTAAPAPAKARTAHHDREHHDENGDEMMQDEEDTVIY